MSRSTFNIGKLFIYIDCQSVLHTVVVVYQLTCGYGQKYIGQTKRNLITRLNEHQTRQSSEVCGHLIENPIHTVMDLIGCERSDRSGPPHVVNILYDTAIRTYFYHDKTTMLI